MTSIQLLWLVLGCCWTLLEIVIAIKTRIVCTVQTNQKYRSETLIWWVVVIAVVAGLGFKQLQLVKLPIPYLPRQWLALLFFGLGLALRFHAIWSLGRFFSTTAVTQQQHILIEQGAYRLIRHPAYSGLLISFFATGLAMGDVLAMLVVFCPIAYVLKHRIRVEEQSLIEHFGQVYVDYSKRTKKLIPWLY